MSFIVRCILVYFFLLLVFRIAGKRALAEITTFDAVLLLVIAESAQQALTVHDASVTNAMLLIGTFIGIELVLTYFTLRSPRLERWLNSRPLAIVRDGKPLSDRMRQAHVNMDEVLVNAGRAHGIAKPGDIEHAVLESNGGISVIPRRRHTARDTA
jgi:uncharacterized membrane protein YcaP (DUF421 family)